MYSNSSFVSVDGQYYINGQPHISSDALLVPVTSPGIYPMQGNRFMINNGLWYADAVDRGCNRQPTDMNGAGTVDIDRTYGLRVDMPVLPNSSGFKVEGIKNKHTPS